MSETEHCLVLIKPDGVELSLTGEVLSHLEREDLFLVVAKAVQPSYNTVALHYFEHSNKPFYDDIIKYLLGKYHNFSWIYAFVFAGIDACNTIRSIAGKTNPLDIDKGKKIVTLRQKYGKNIIVKDENNKEIFDSEGHVVVRYENVIHASFSDAAEYEVKLWFSPEEIILPYRKYDTVEKDGRLYWKKPFFSLFKERFGDVKTDLLCRDLLQK